MTSQKSLKRPRVEAEKDTPECFQFTVKCGLRRILREVSAKELNDTSKSFIHEKLREIVKRTSTITTLMTSLINYHVLRILDGGTTLSEITQTTICRACALVSGKKCNDEHLNVSFIAWKRVSPSAFAWPTATGLTKLLDQMCKDYLVNCKNHIATNFEHFHRRYLRIRMMQILRANNLHLSSKRLGLIVWELYRSTTRDHLFQVPESKDKQKDAEKIHARLDELTRPLATEVRGVLQPLWPINDVTLQRSWYTFLPWFRRMGKLIEAERNRLQTELKVDGVNEKGISAMRRNLRGVRSFSLLPHRKPRAIHIVLTNSTMHSIRTSLGLPTNKDRPFDDVFFFNRLHGSDSRMFANVIRTDGEAASVLMYRNKTDGARLLQEKKDTSNKRKESRAAAKRLKTIQSKSYHKLDDSDPASGNGKARMDMEDVDVKHKTPMTTKATNASKMNKRDRLLPIVPIGLPVIGLDPGICHPFVAVGVPCKNGATHQARISNGEFRWLAGAHTMSQKRKQIEARAKKTDPILATYLSAGVLVKTVDTKSVLFRAEHDFKCFQSAMEYSCQPKVVKLKLRAYQRRQQALDFACRMVTGRALWNNNGHPIFGKQEKTCTWQTRRDAQIVAFGDAGFSSCMRGNPPVAVRGFKERLKFHSRVVQIDEYKTSQICAHCDAQLINQTPNVHGVRVCTNSSAHAGRVRTFVDRDSNAAINMQRLFIAKQQGIVLAPFVRIRNTPTRLVASAACFI